LKQVFFRRGEVVVEDVPAPAAEAGAVIVRTAYSCISSGTELAGVRASGRSLLARAIEEPAKVGRLVAMAAAHGAREALRSVLEKADVAHPTGYSAAGIVVEVGEGVPDLRAGDRVACAGSQSAHHAELIRVPRNLCARVPDELDLDAAATVTLGAIALQGVRRANPTLGETFAVIGLGILGQLTVQLLKANGCRAIAIDVDPARVQLARSLGADWGLDSTDEAVADAVLRHTGGHGADGAIVTASGSSDAILSLAFNLCRKKARVVLVGDVGMNLQRADIYEKELDFLVSSSYGPGRYDRRYEEEGLDYPIGYVRWTENRNMAEFLSLLASGKVSVAPLLGNRFDVGQAPAAYASLQSASRPLSALLEYRNAPSTGPVRMAPAIATKPGRLRLALIGAGSFARAAHVPALRSLSERYAIQAVVSRTGHKAKELAANVGAAYASSDVDAVLADQDVDAVLIATRHDSHARLALRALQAGKHVLVEKPLALEPGELDAIEAFFQGRAAGAAPLLMTGFNRRFAPCGRALRALIAESGGPAVLSYRMNAGFLPADHWVFGAEGGGRNRGEACHLYDFLTDLTGAKLRSVSAEVASPRGGPYRADDNFSATLAFEDGSVANVLYTAMGSAAASKEQLDAYFSGAVARLDDYRRLEIAGRSAPLVQSSQPEKGLREELEAFHAAATGGGDWPIPLWQQLQATRIAFEVERRIGGG
jgi:predicted dehydrogenase